MEIITIYDSISSFSTSTNTFLVRGLRGYTLCALASAMSVRRPGFDQRCDACRTRLCNILEPWCWKPSADCRARAVGGKLLDPEADMLVLSAVTFAVLELCGKFRCLLGDGGERWGVGSARGEGEKRYKRILAQSDNTQGPKDRHCARSRWPSSPRSDPVGKTLHESTYDRRPDIGNSGQELRRALPYCLRSSGAQARRVDW